MGLLNDPRPLITGAELARMVGDTNPRMWARRHGIRPACHIKVPGAPGSPAALYDAREVSRVLNTPRTRPARFPGPPEPG